MINNLINYAITGSKQIGAIAITTAVGQYAPKAVKTYGVVKAVIDSLFILPIAGKLVGNTYNSYQARNNWDTFKGSKSFQIIKEKLKIDVTQDDAKIYFDAKWKKNTEKLGRLVRSIVADLVLLVPAVGVHLSWRISSGYSSGYIGPDFTLIFEKSTSQLVTNFRKFIFNPVVPISKKVQPEFEAYDALSIPVNTATRSRNIRAYYFDMGNPSMNVTEKPTVVIFHGNGMEKQDLSNYAKQYNKLGYAAVIMNYGGYPGSPGVNTSEASMYQDVTALQKFLLGKGVTEVAYHGCSLGGSAASYAAANPIKDLKTLFVTAEITFTSAKNAGGQFVANLIGNLSSLAGRVVAPFARGAVDGLMPAGISVELPGNQWTTTDGLNSLAKMKTLRDKEIPVYFAKTSHDHFMGRKGDMNQGFEENFADDLSRTRYPTDEISKHVYNTQGARHQPALLEGQRDFFDLIPIVSK